MGEVYLAEDSLLGRRVALKRLLPIFANDEDFVARFKREARSVSRLAHPGIVTIHSLDWVSGVLLIDMEYVDGTSLHRLLQTSVVTREFTARLAHEMLAALAECHEQGIVHRDIKPSNILLTESMQSKLVDFGIATALADSTATQLREGRSTTIVLGTPRFMAPEAWDGAPVSPQWDLFALGVVLYECLTGEVAYKGATTSALARQITNEPLPRIAGRVKTISAPLARLVDSLVMIDAGQRCKSAREGLAILADAPELSAQMGATTVHRSPTKLLQNSWQRAGAVARRPAMVRLRRWALTVLWGVMGGGLLVAGVDYWSRTKFITPPTENLPEQGESRTLAMSPDGMAYTVQPLTSGSSGTWHWWVSQDELASQTVVVGYSPLAILRMTMAEREGQVHFSGTWAGYSSPLARGFQSGPVSGLGRWQGERHALALSLDFTDSGRSTTQHESFIAERSQTILSESSLLRAIEAADVLPTLLYYALQPRGLPLGHEFDALLPANGQRVITPLIADDAAPVVDGLLEDETWREPIFDRSGRIGELIAARGMRIDLRRTQAGLYLAMRVEATAGGSLEAQFGLMRGIARPPRWGERAILTVRDTTVRNRDRHYFVGEFEAPFPDDWVMAAAVSDGRWNFEMFVPFDSGVSPSAPWRLNAKVVEASSDGLVRDLAQWGDPDVRALEHGALITFQDSAQ